MTLQSRLAALVSAIGADIKTVSNKVRTVRVVSTTNTALSGSGGGFGRIDDVLIGSGDRILLVGQTNQTQNGVYMYSVNGLTGGWSFDRAPDFDQSSKIAQGQIISVMEGTKHAGSQYIVGVDNPTMGTTPITFVATGKSIVPVVNALPPGATDGDEVYFQNAAMAADGVMWHLRYRAAAPGLYKWERIGGSALHESDGNTVGATTSPTAYTGVAFVSPTFNLPLAGDYDISWTSVVGNTPFNVGDFRIFPYVGAAGVMGTGTANWVNATWYQHFNGRQRFPGAAAGAPLTLRHMSASTSMTFNVFERVLTAIPVRVG